MITKLFRNANICTPVSIPGNKTDVDVLSFHEGALLTRDGLILRVGDERTVLNGLSLSDVDIEVDCGGRCMVPGFVDPHTHMCFVSLREKEFSLRLSGTPYLEILKKGGGILSSVRSLRNASDEDIFIRTANNVKVALMNGTTTIEIKSGYGLDTANEIRMLRIISRVGRTTPVDVVPTFMGAHAVPEEFKNDPDSYVDLLVNEMIPLVAKECAPSFCDVFCEEGVFSVPQSRRILKAARDSGMLSKIHADEVTDVGGAALAAEIGAVSAEHLLAAREEHLFAMASSGVVAVLLPATAYSLGKPFANARRMIDIGLAVALATDCNPGSSFTHSMPFVFSLAVLNMKMTVNEALAGCTLNAARAIGVEAVSGSLEKGKKADLLLLEGETPAILAYQNGISPTHSVYKMGERIDCDSFYGRFS